MDGGMDGVVGRPVPLIGIGGYGYCRKSAHVDWVESLPLGTTKNAQANTAHSKSLVAWLMDGQCRGEPLMRSDLQTD